MARTKVLLLRSLVLCAGVFLVHWLSGCQGEKQEAPGPAALPSPAVPNPTLPPSPELLHTPTGVPARPRANADVLFVRAIHEEAGTWRFEVTVSHPDTGWQDYADGWDVVLPDGAVLKPDAQSAFTRALLHPHENEQPFTRSQSGIVIPPEVQNVTVRAHDRVDGFGGAEVVVDLRVPSGPGFEVQR